MVETSRAGDQGVEVRLLGPLEALKDGRPVTLGGAKPRALRAALALEPGRVVSVDRLVEDLWPGEPRKKNIAMIAEVRARLTALEDQLASA